MQKNSGENTSEYMDKIISSYDKFELINRRLVDVSENNLGKLHTGRQRRALFVMNKLIVHNMSTGLIVDQYFKDTKNGLLDHFSMAALARASIDASLMTMYISEPSLSLTGWDFRRQILYLHDSNNRSRFLKPFRSSSETKPFFNSRDDAVRSIHEKIDYLGRKLLIPEDKISEYQKGINIFVDGVRGAVREAKWDNEIFDFNQSYLSAYVHTHPVSFINADNFDIRFSGASDFQISFASYVLETISEYSQSVAERMEVFSDPDIGDPNGHLD